MRFLILLIVIVLLVVTYTKFFEYGKGALKQGDFQTAQKVFRPDAEMDNTEAQTYLGTMYAKGLIGENPDSAKGFFWLSRAASRGEPRAQSELGIMFLTGWGVRQDETEALRWLEKAGNQGNTDAQIALADIYANGRDNIPQNYEESYFWRSLYIFGGCDFSTCHEIMEKLSPQQTSAVNQRLIEWKKKYGPLPEPSIHDETSSLTEEDVSALKILNKPLPEWIIKKLSESKNDGPDKIQERVYKGVRAFQINPSCCDSGATSDLLDEDGKHICFMSGTGPSAQHGNCGPGGYIRNLNLKNE